jgi:hypothetical protein
VPRLSAGLIGSCKLYHAASARPSKPCPAPWELVPAHLQLLAYGVCQHARQARRTERLSLISSWQLQHCLQWHATSKTVMRGGLHGPKKYPHMQLGGMR